MIELLDFLQELHPMSAELEREIRKAMRCKELGRGKHWLRTGEVCNNIAFIEQVPPGTNLRVATTIVAADAKRIHLFHEMRRESDGARLATYELLVLHVDQAGPRVTAMPPVILDKVNAIAADHASLAAALPQSGTSRILLALKPR